MAIPAIVAGALAAGRFAAPFLARALAPQAARAIAPTVVRGAITAGSRPAVTSVGSTFARAAIGGTPARTFAMQAPQVARTFAMPARAPIAQLTSRVAPSASNLRIPFTAAARGTGPRAFMSASTGAAPRAAMVVPRAAVTSGFSRVFPMGGRVAAPSATRALGAASTAARPGVSSAFPRAGAQTFPMGGRGATSSATRGAFSPLERGATSAFPRGEFSTLPAAREAGRSIISRALGVGGRGGKVELAAGLSPLAVPVVEGATGVDVPEPIEQALNLLAVGAGLRFGGRRVLEGASKIGAGQRAAGARRIAAGTAVGALPLAFTYGPLSGLGAEQPPAVADTDTGEFIIPEDGITGPGGTRPGTPEDDAETQLDAIDAAFQAAVDEITASYGGVEEALRALDTGDPYLAQALASLDSQYRQAQLAVAAEYSAAVGDIAGYQEQADALMEEVAAQQMADFEAAAGGLENIEVGVDPATAAMSDEAGVSDTALGGGAITGAGLARGLAGAASAEGAASRLRTGSELAGLVAATRQDAAAQQAALTQNYLGQRYQAEVDAAMAEAERRQAIEDAIIQNKLEMGQALSSLELQRAQQLAALSPQDFAAASGQTRAVTSPRWFGAQLGGDLNQTVRGLVFTDEDTGVSGPVSVGSAQSLLDQLYATSSVARNSFNQGDPSTAYAQLAEFYGQLGQELEWLSALGAPTNAYQAYTDLFGQEPF